MDGEDFDPLNETVNTQDLKKFEERFYSEVKAKCVDDKTQFEYAWCLIRSKYPGDIKKGLYLLEELLGKGDHELTRDYLYYLALGSAKLKEYNTSLMYIRKLLQSEPSNRQGLELESIVKKKLQNEGLKGLAIVGGAAALTLGALVGFGVALSRK